MERRSKQVAFQSPSNLSRNSSSKDIPLAVTGYGKLNQELL